MVSKKLPYDTNDLPYDVYMGDSRPQCSCLREIVLNIIIVIVIYMIKYNIGDLGRRINFIKSRF